jgi:hypothetical protein
MQTSVHIAIAEIAALTIVLVARAQSGVSVSNARNHASMAGVLENTAANKVACIFGQLLAE